MHVATQAAHQSFHGNPLADAVHDFFHIGVVCRQAGGKAGYECLPEFNRTYDIATLIEGHGYKRIGGKWLCPHSSSGDPGVTISEGKLYSHHSSDPLANGHKNDAFDVYCILMHDGNQREATKAAARMLGLDAKSRPPAPPPIGELTQAPSANEPVGNLEGGLTSEEVHRHATPATSEPGAAASSVNGVPINAESGFVVASATRALVVVRSTMEAVL